jgi:hypothetical protein
MANIFDNLTSEQREGVIASTKLGTVWAAVGITTWADFAAFMAAIYSVLLVGEFAWKKMLRPFAEWRGWITTKEKQ